MKIVVVGDPDTCLAFAVAGIEGRPVSWEGEVPALLEKLAREEPVLILITEPLAESHRDFVEGLRLKSGGLLLLEIPGVSGPSMQRENAARRILSLMGSLERAHLE